MNDCTMAILRLSNCSGYQANLIYGYPLQHGFFLEVVNKEPQFNQNNTFSITAAKFNENIYSSTAIESQAQLGTGNA